MIKQIAGAVAVWLLMLTFFLSIMFFCNSFIAFMVSAVFILIPPVTFLMNRFAKKHIQAAVWAQTSISKEEKASGTIILQNTGVLPVVKVYCKISVVNQLTGQKHKILLPMSAAPKAETKGSFTVYSEHCGYLEISVEELRLMDWFGFLPLKIPQNVKTHISVLPDTFMPNVFLNLAMAEKEDSENWSPVKKGNDLSELFALRDYVAGDSLKYIHWKLSAKKGQMIVKEPSLPIEKSLLIFWDKNGKSCSAEEMDAMAECVASVAQAIISQGISFVLGWTEGKNPVFEVIDTDEQLLQAIPRMLKHGADIAPVRRTQERTEEYGKIIYFAKAAGQMPEMFNCTDMTILLCGQDTYDSDGNIIVFRADRYMEDLEYIEI